MLISPIGEYLHHICSAIRIYPSFCSQDHQASQWAEITELSATATGSHQRRTNYGAFCFLQEALLTSSQTHHHNHRRLPKKTSHTISDSQCAVTRCICTDTHQQDKNCLAWPKPTPVKFSSWSSNEQINLGHKFNSKLWQKSRTSQTNTNQ